MQSALVTLRYLCNSHDLIGLRLFSILEQSFFKARLPSEYADLLIFMALRHECAGTGLVVGVVRARRNALHFRSQ